MLLHLIVTSCYPKHPGRSVIGVVCLESFTLDRFFNMMYASTVLQALTVMLLFLNACRHFFCST